ncbi:MAG TPA: TIM barrel protein [Tepidisphaeraceae bacterium]|jgi:hexulose-6-phosphate isomerase|nr:TIM barrel protein [Tepidisphaeraceae bacterium]
MNLPIPTRREFLAASAAASAMLLPSLPAFADETLRGTIRKAMIIGPVTEATLTPLKEAGFAGVESQTYNITEEEGTRAKGHADKLGMRIHSVMRGWAEFNSDDPKKVEATLEQTRQAMRAAKWYGADDILLVPCRIGGMPMPDPGDFNIEFDEKTGHVSKVVDGDNSKYEAYIAAQNKATDTSKAAVEKLIPFAEELKIIIAIENVWNNLWVQPKLYKNFVASFNHPLVRSYFDVGNHVKYRKTPVQDWIPILGKLIVRLHFKGYHLGATTAQDKWVHLRDKGAANDSIDWKAVRKALSDINFDGWACIEEGGLPLAEFDKRFDLIIEGK